ncbi:MAG: ABC transporter ATP-binding protein [Planctomycetes bacterium]|nr:ABC transporter ATP-binding protein [Planctomycetota bacterium]
MSDFCIETEGLTRVFGALVAVDRIEVRVPRGCFYGFLGPNGAGKSTTIKMLTGLLKPTAGRARILGLDLERDLLEIKRRIGVVPEGLHLFERLTGREFLTFVGRMYGMDRATVATRTNELIALMDLDEKQDALIVDYSHGMRKKIALSAALIHDPEIYFLDEPFEGVDAVASKQIRDVLQTLVRKRATVFLTSHILEIVERLCTHIGIIQKGRLVAQGSIEELRGGAGRGAAAPPGEAGAPTVPQTLEEVFLSFVQEQGVPEHRLSWLD